MLDDMESRHGERKKAVTTLKNGDPAKAITAMGSKASINQQSSKAEETKKN